MLAFTGCEKYDDLYPEAVHKVLTIKNAGEQNVMLYTTGDDGTYNISIMKGGSEADAPVSAELVVMGEAELAEYCNKYDANYKRLPEEYYSLSANRLDYVGGEGYKIVTASFKTDNLKKFFETNGTDYVLPLMLLSEEATLEDSLVILKPSITVPMLKLTTAGFNNMVTFTPDGDSEATVSLPVTMPLMNNWDFTCDLVVDEDAKAAFTSFNAANNNRYKLLPEGSYTLAGNGKISFTKDQKDGFQMEVTINRNPLSIGDYVLPLHLTNCTKEQFDIDGNNNIVMVGVSYYPPKVEMTVDMLSANSIHVGDGTGLAGLIDGLGSGKHFHSNWGSPVKDPVFGNYIQVNLKSPLRSIMVDYYTRFENANGCPTKLALFVSNDGNNWTELVTIDSGLPRTANTRYISQLYEANEPFTYFRFAVLQSAAGDLQNVGSYFNLDDLTLYGEE